MLVIAENSDQYLIAAERTGMMQALYTPVDCRMPWAKASRYEMATMIGTLVIPGLMDGNVFLTYLLANALP